MQIQAQENLRKLILQFGKEVVDDLSRCEALIRDFLPDCRKEVNLLIDSLKEGVPAALVSSKSALPPDALLANLSKRLTDNRGIAEDAAWWSVESWALAMGFIEQPLVNPETAQSPAKVSPLPTTETGKGAKSRRVAKGDTSSGKRADFVEAINYYKRALELNPKEPLAHFNLGVVYWQTGNNDFAVSEFLQVIQLDPDLVDAYANLGFLYIEKQLYDEAIKQLSKAIKVNPNYPTLHYYLGVAFRQKGMGEEALKEFSRILQLDPNFVDAHLNLGYVYYEKKDYDKAIESYQMALSLNPNYWVAHYNLGLAYRQSERWGKAVGSFQKTVDLNPGFADGLINLEFAKQKLAETRG